jgi:hypothetical protein
MNCDLENSFLLVYLSGPLIINNGPHDATPAYPPPLLGGPASGFHTKIIVRHDIAEILLKVALNTIKQTD